MQNRTFMKSVLFILIGLFLTLQTVGQGKAITCYSDHKGKFPYIIVALNEESNAYHLSICLVTTPEYHPKLAKTMLMITLSDGNFALLPFEEFYDTKTENSAGATFKIPEKYISKLKQSSMLSIHLSILFKTATTEEKEIIIPFNILESPEYFLKNL